MNAPLVWSKHQQPKSSFLPDPLLPQLDSRPRPASRAGRTPPAAQAGYKISQMAPLPFSLVSAPTSDNSTRQAQEQETLFTENANYGWQGWQAAGWRTGRSLCRQLATAHCPTSPRAPVTALSLHGREPTPSTTHLLLSSFCTKVGKVANTEIGRQHGNTNAEKRSRGE